MSSWEVKPHCCIICMFVRVHFVGNAFVMIYVLIHSCCVVTDVVTTLMTSQIGVFAELEKARKDLATMKKQAESTNAEYDRLLAEHAKLQVLN